MRLSGSVVVLLVACGEGGDGQPAPIQTTRVPFEYLASTTVDPAIAAQFPSCVAGVSRTHIHPSWHRYELHYMTAEGADRWSVAFTDVPVGVRIRVRVSDPNVCAENATGAATRNVYANGVLLTDVVDTPGSGIEPGLALTVAADGMVTP